jgi:hypothetical protein
MSDAKEAAEIEKLNAETDLIKKTISDSTKPKTSSKIETTKSILNIISSSIGISAAVVGVLAGIFALAPDYQKFKEALNVRNKVSLSDGILKQVNRLDNDTTKEQAAMLLSYYGLNSIPILFYKIETADDTEVWSKSIDLIILFNDDPNQSKAFVLNKIQSRLMTLVNNELLKDKPELWSFGNSRKYINLIKRYPLNTETIACLKNLIDKLSLVQGKHVKLKELIKELSQIIETNKNR